MDSENYERYLELDKIWEGIKRKGKQDTREEDDLLSEMDIVWYNLTKEEKQKFNSKG